MNVETVRRRLKEHNLKARTPAKKTPFLNKNYEKISTSEDKEV